MIEIIFTVLGIMLLLTIIGATLIALILVYYGLIVLLTTLFTKDK